MLNDHLSVCRGAHLGGTTLAFEAPPRQTQPKQESSNQA
jgi:hypothetical protein